VDPSLLSLVDELVQPGAVVWDVGANVGLFAFAAANRAGRGGLIVSMEPDAWLVQLLRRSCNVQPHSSASVKIVPAAIASSVGLRTFCLAKRSRSANHLAEYGTDQAGGKREEQVVLTVPLDWLLAYYPSPSVLKIDVEGAELEVLRGASRLFETARPIVICEVGSSTQADVTAFFRSQGYQLYDGQTPAEKRTPVSSATWNTVAMPG
jgi:FkbM family methyltransferase